MRLNGKKTYIGLVVAAVVLIVHALGVHVPGVKIDDQHLTANLWRLFMIGAARSALAKIASPQDLARLLALLAANQKETP